MPLTPLTRVAWGVGGLVISPCPLLGSRKMQVLEGGQGDTNGTVELTLMARRSLCMSCLPAAPDWTVRDGAEDGLNGRGVRDGQSAPQAGLCLRSCRKKNDILCRAFLRMALMSGSHFKS